MIGPHFWDEIIEAGLSPHDVAIDAAGAIRVDRLLPEAERRRITTIAKSVLTRHDPSAAPMKSRALSVRDFRNLFTAEEQAAIWQASITNAAVGVLLVKLSTVESVALSDPAIRDALALIQDAGLVTAERRALIAAGKPPS